MTTIAEKDRQAVRDALARDLVADVELLLFLRQWAEHSTPSAWGRDERPTSDETRELLEDLAALSPRLHVTSIDVDADPVSATQYNVRALPTVIIRRLPGTGQVGAVPAASPAIMAGAPTVRFLGLPAGYEFSTLVAAVVDTSRGTTSLTQPTRETVRSWTDPVHLQVFVTPNCPYCPRAARVAHQFAMENPLVLAEVIEANEFQELSTRYAVRTVPKTIINDRVEFVGSLPEANVVEAVKEAVRRAG